MKKRILCFGDSNTWGADSENDGRHAPDVRWTGILQKELGEEYVVIEEGYNGRTSVFDDPIENRLSGIAYFETCIDSQSPLDLIIIMLGTNDLKQRFGVNAKTIAYGFLRYLNAVAVSPMNGKKPQILLTAPIEISPAYKKHALFHDMFGEYGAERSKEFASAYQEFAENAGIAFLNAAAYAHADEIDGIHMDASQHEALGKAFAAKAKELLG